MTNAQLMQGFCIAGLSYTQQQRCYATRLKVSQFRQVHIESIRFKVHHYKEDTNNNLS